MSKCLSVFVWEQFLYEVLLNFCNVKQTLSQQSIYSCIYLSNIDVVYTYYLGEYQEQDMYNGYKQQSTFLPLIYIFTRQGIKSNNNHILNFI